MKNQLQVIIRESGLEKTKAQYFLDNFQDYFSIASEWEKKAKMIKVTDASQTDDMKMARTGRLILREKRIDVEKARKRLKEDYLRGGKLVDHIAGVLKETLLPIENYLDRQERFVEIKAEEKRDAVRLEVEKRIEDERIAKEKADAEALEKARIENEKLKAEAIESEKKAQVERKKQEAKLTKERAKVQAEREKAEAKQREADEEARLRIEKIQAGKLFAEEKARLEKDKQEKTLANERAKAKRLKELDDKKAEAKLEAERKEKERLEELLKNQVECPFCHKKFQLQKEQ